MSVNNVSSADALLALLTQSSRNASATSATGDTASFAAYLANLQAQALGTLTGAGSGPTTTSGLADLLAALQGSAGTLTATSTGLADPASAFSMMSFINGENVEFKAEYAELSQMGDYVSGLQQAGTTLAGLDATTGDAAIATQLQSFVSQYNDWVTRFDADMQSGGVLADTRAAQVSRYELAQSIQNRFNGVADGINGLADLGVTIDAGTGKASLDTTKLQATLAGNRQGVIDTLQQFGANFAKSAHLLDSSGNFIANRLDNLDRAIGYIGDNLSSLQAEFGIGAPATPTGQVAQALAAYNETYGLS